MADIVLTRVDAGNLDREHICCAIGEDKENKARAAEKKAWLAERLAEGRVFLKADIRGKAFVEFGPAELAWQPLEAPGWFFSRCFWVSGKYAGTGLGSRLLEAAEAEVRARGGRGLCFLAAAKGKKPFLTEGKYLLSKGYEAADEALGFALFAKELGAEAAPRRAGRAAVAVPPAPPRFPETARAGRLPRAAKGVDLFYAAECPFAPSVAKEMAEAARGQGFAARLHELSSREAAAALRAPPGIFQAYLDGVFLTHELMTPAKFAAALESGTGR